MNFTKITTNQKAETNKSHYNMKNFLVKTLYYNILTSVNLW